MEQNDNPGQEFAVKFNAKVQESTLEDLTKRYTDFKNVFGDDPKQRRVYVGIAKYPHEAVVYVQSNADEIIRATVPPIRYQIE